MGTALAGDFALVGVGPVEVTPWVCGSSSILVAMGVMLRLSTGLVGRLPPELEKLVMTECHCAASELECA